MKRYDLIVIGGGSAGLVAASGAASLGARVALIDKGSLGGDCLWAGCVPTKRLIESARTASLIRRAGEFGLEAGELKVDFKKVTSSMRVVQKKIAEHDSPDRFKKMGIDVIFGSGRFLDSHLFEVNGEVVSGRRFIIATGSSPATIPVPGLKDAALTSDTVLSLERLPRSLAILGAGPIGIEYAQLFERLGSKVTVLEKNGQILPREDKELSSALYQILSSERVAIDLATEAREVVRADGGVRIKALNPMGERTYEVEAVMTAAGRIPNVSELNLEAAGVEYDLKHGIKVDGRLRTTARNIYACGDVIGQYAFTHVAEYHARIAVGNALFPLFKRKVDYRVVPWTTFTDPELARVGLTEEEAREKHGDKVRVYKVNFSDIDRAVIEGEGIGFVKLVCEGKKVLGAHILGPHAGELIHEYVLAMEADVPVSRLSRAIHVYPTDAMAVKKASDEYYKERLLKGWFPRFTRIFSHHGI